MSLLYSAAWEALAIVLGMLINPMVVVFRDIGRSVVALEPNSGDAPVMRRRRPHVDCL